MDDLAPRAGRAPRAPAGLVRIRPLERTLLENDLIEIAGKAASGLSVDQIHDVIFYLLWIAHFRRGALP